MQSELPALHTLAKTLVGETEFAKATTRLERVETVGGGG